MKKSVFVLLFAIIGMGAAFADITGNAVVTGTVAQQLSVAIAGVNAGTSNTTFELNPAGGTQSLGSATIISNLKSWKITVSSAKAGNLKNDSDLESIDYTFTMGSLTSLQGVSLTSAINQSMTAKTPKAGTLYAMSITYDDDDGTFWSYDGGNFTDTITVTVAAN